MNERLTIQQGLFLCASHPLFSFRGCLVALLLHARNGGKPSRPKENGTANHAEHAKGGGALQGQNNAFDLKARLAEVE